jgi:hypothetical protein
MSHLAEDIDSVAIETRAESARVESGFEAFDPVATKIAFDQIQRITRTQGDSVAETTKEKQFSQTWLDHVPTSSALVLASGPAATEDELATLVASFTTEYNNLDSEISDLTDDLLGHERKLAGRYRDELLPMINQMQMLLSQRGALHALVAKDGSLANKLKQLEDVPTWTEWYEAFASRVSEAKSLRTVQRQLKKLRGKTEPVTDADDDGDDNDNDTDTPSALGGFDARDEVKTGAELLAEHIKQMIKVLAGKSIMTDGMRNKRALGLLKDLQHAVEEGLLLVAPPVAEHANAAAPPDKLDPSVSELTAEPDWKQVLVELLQVLEQSGDRLPVVVLAEKRKTESLLTGKGPGRPEGVPFSTTTKSYTKVMKLDPEGNRRWAVMAEGKNKAWGTFEIESDADKAVAHLSSPVASLSDFEDEFKKLPNSVTLEEAGCMDLHEGAS